MDSRLLSRTPRPRRPARSMSGRHLWRLPTRKASRSARKPLGLTFVSGGGQSPPPFFFVGLQNLTFLFGTMDLRPLRFFVAVAEEFHLYPAAPRVRHCQPTAS